MVKILELVIAAVNLFFDAFKVLKTTDKEKKQIKENVEELRATAAERFNPSECKKKAIKRIFKLSLVILAAIAMSNKVGALSSSIFGKLEPLADSVFDVLPDFLVINLITSTAYSMYANTLYLIGYRDGIVEKMEKGLQKYKHVVGITVCIYGTTVILALCTGNIDAFLSCVNYILWPSETLGLNIWECAFVLAAVRLFWYMCKTEIPAIKAELPETISALKARRKDAKRRKRQK